MKGRSYILSELLARLLVVGSLHEFTVRPPRAALILALAVAVAGVLPVFLTGALSVQMRAELAFADRQLGVGVGLFFLTGALASMLVGRSVQRLGARGGMRAAAALSFAALVGIGLGARSWTTVMVLLMLAGLGNSAAHPAANLALVAFLPQRRQGLVFGVKQAAVPVATLLAGAAVPALALTLGWRAAFLVAALIPAAVMVGASNTPEPTRRADGVPIPGRAGAGRMAALALVAIGSGTGSMAGNAAATYLVPSAVASGIAEASAGVVLAVSSSVGIVVRVLVGWRVDSVSHGPLNTAAVMIWLGSFGFVMLSADSLWLLVLAGMIAFGLGWGWAGLVNMAVATSDRAKAASATGVLQTGVYIGAGGGPMLFGILASATSFTVAWWATGATALVSGVLMQLGQRSITRQYPPAQRTPSP